MEQKKSKKADLENKKFIFTEFGLIIALALMLLAFEWKSYEKPDIEIISRQVENVAEDIIPITEQKVKPPAAPIKQVIKINIVENDIIVDEDFNINVEATENTEVEEYIAPVKIEEEQQVDEDQIFMVVESMPQYPGGDVELYKYLADNIRYPNIAREAGISGRVFVSFVVEKDGSVTDVKILRGIGGGCDEEAIRLVKSMPKWSPGLQRGKAVRVTYNLSVKFNLIT